jgi:Flp pilus assembly protein TadD
MTTRAFSALMASAVVFSVSLTGCGGAGVQRPKVTVAAPQSLALKIERLLAEKQADGAMVLAEQLVALEPENGDARALLGRAYLANGRYLSARTSFNDALTLGNRDPRTLVSLAMCESALENPHGARQILADHIANIPAGDYGLAMAMAGDPEEAVRALLEASRGPDSTPKTRQNLAYALAMAGAWGQARLVAGQDLDARSAEQRIGEWTQSFATDSGSDRVVAMIGVLPRGDDAGLPVQLALNLVPAQSESQLALAETTPLAQVEAPAAAQEPTQDAPRTPAFAPNALAAVFESLPDVPAVARTSPAAQAAFASASADDKALRPVFATKTEAVPSAAQVVMKSSQPENRAAFSSAAASSVSGKSSDWVVQLGAFNSEAVARERWQSISRGRAELKSFAVVHSVFSADNRAYHRLAVRGFEDRRAAVSACASLKATGQACFVRLDDRLASQPQRVAAVKQGKPLAVTSSPVRTSRPS